jgi:hypothetical protein
MPPDLERAVEPGEHELVDGDPGREHVQPVLSDDAGALVAVPGERREAHVRPGAP